MDCHRFLPMSLFGIRVLVYCPNHDGYIYNLSYYQLLIMSVSCIISNNGSFTIGPFLTGAVFGLQSSRLDETYTRGLGWPCAKIDPIWPWDLLAISLASGLTLGTVANWVPTISLSKPGSGPDADLLTGAVDGRGFHGSINNLITYDSAVTEIRPITGGEILHFELLRPSLKCINVYIIYKPT